MSKPIILSSYIFPFPSKGIRGQYGAALLQCWLKSRPSLPFGAAQGRSPTTKFNSATKPRRCTGGPCIYVFGDAAAVPSVPPNKSNQAVHFGCTHCRCKVSTHQVL